VAPFRQGVHHIKDALFLFLPAAARPQADEDVFKVGVNLRLLPPFFRKIENQRAQRPFGFVRLKGEFAAFGGRLGGCSSLFVHMTIVTRGERIGRGEFAFSRMRVPQREFGNEGTASKSALISPLGMFLQLRGNRAPVAALRRQELVQ
jgi:hypothetical protein